MAQDLVVRISATTQGLKEAFRDAENQTAKLKDSLSSTAQTAGIAFAAFSGVISGSIAAFRGQELATNQLNVALKNQGMFTEELSKKYQDMATSLQRVTTFGDEEIISAQAQLQAMIGQNEVTEELTKSVLDLASAKSIDLASAASLVGKTIGTTTNALARQGIEIDNTLKGQARLDAVVTALNSKFSGQAAAAAAGSGAFLQLKNAAGDVVEEIGRNLVPILAPLAQGLTNIFSILAANKEFAALAAKVLLAGAAITGIVTTVAVLAIGFLKLKALIAAVAVVVNGATLSFGFLAGATGIGLVIIAIGLLAFYWEDSLKFITAVTSSWAKQIMPLLYGVGNLIKGILLFDNDSFVKGLEQTKNALKSGAQEFTAIRAKQASDELAIEEQKSADKLRIEQEQALKFKEVKAAADQAKIDAEKNQQERMQELRLAGEESRKQSLAEFEYAKANISNTIADEQLARDRQEKLTRLQDEMKYGEELAKAKALFRSSEFKAVNEGLGNLSTLTASKNKEMFELGKAASLASAIINTAEGATKALGQGGIFGPILAATVIAAGAVQIATIGSQKFGYADGGPVYGGIKGVDSVPAMLMPGELVVPEKNFEETVQAVSSSRAGGGGEMIVVELRGKGGFMDYIETQIVERRRLDVGIGV